MPSASLPAEIVWLGASVVLLLVYIGAQAGLMTRDLGREFNVSARDEQPEPKGVMAGRAERALANLLETYPAFVALALALAVTGRSGGAGAIGAAVWFWARVVYLPLYLFGIPYVRTAVWSVSALGLGGMLYRLFFF